MPRLLRTTIMTLASAALVLVLFWRLSIDQERRAWDEIETLRADMTRRIESREAMIDRLSRSRRVAHLRVVDQTTDGAGRVDETTLELIELDDAGGELARQRFAVPGHVVTIDGWTVKFDRANVAEGHPLSGHTLLLLRRVYSELMPAVDGFPIDMPGAIPPGYAVGDVSLFEQKVWEHFWDLATDADMARAMGVRVAQGEAIYKPVRTGQLYELSLDAAGGMNLVPLSAMRPEVAVVGSGE